MEQHHCVADRPFAGCVGGAVDELCADGHGGRAAAGRYSRDRARVALDPEAVLELRVLRPDEPLCVSGYVDRAVAQQTRSAVDDARLPDEGCAISRDPGLYGNGCTGSCVGAQPLCAVSRAVEDGTVFGYGPASRLAQL